LVVRKAQEADLPDWLLSRMLANNAVSLAAGFLPFAGDIVLAAYKVSIIYHIIIIIKSFIAY
jgi:hypothetical protein